MAEKIKGKKGGEGAAVIGALTFWPVLYGALFTVFIFFRFFTLMASFKTDCQIPDFFLILMPVHAATCLLTAALIFYYVIHASRNEKIENDLKPLWVMGIIVGNIIVMPVYWLVYIRGAIKKTGGKNGKKRRK